MIGSKTLKLALTLVLGLIISASALSEVYKTVDANGKVTFTDIPGENAKPVELATPNSAKAIDIPIRIEPLPDPESPKYTLSISSPLDGSSVNGLTTLSVVGKVSPALKTEHKVQLLLNGQNHSTSRTTNFNITGLPRGEHALQLAILDENGTTLHTSAVVTISATRPSNLINTEGASNLPAPPGINPPPARPKVSPR